jgi:hypothetical protein
MFFVGCDTTRVETIESCKTLTKPMATYGTESWSLNKATVKRLAAFKNKFQKECLEE